MTKDTVSISSTINPPDTVHISKLLYQQEKISFYQDHVELSPRETAFQLIRWSLNNLERIRTVYFPLLEQTAVKNAEVLRY